MLTKDKIQSKFDEFIHRSRPKIKAVAPEDFPKHSERDITLAQMLETEIYFTSLMDELLEMAEVQHIRASASHQQQSPMLPSYHYGVEDGIRAVQAKLKQIRQAVTGPDKE